MCWRSVVDQNGLRRWFHYVPFGNRQFLGVSNALIRSVWRGYHDGKAAMRYFRKTAAEDGNPWGIDPDRIYFAGVSAGGFIGLHLA